jgi:rfaE bifunctional protein kinase chain/domain
MTLLEVIEKLSSIRLLVVGDAINDRYVFGRVERLCPEGPVPVLIRERVENRNGGAAHVVDQVRALGAQCVGFHGMPICQKTRFMVGSHMLLREDDERRPVADHAQMVEALNKFIFGESKIDAIILSDYAKGTLMPEVCKAVLNFATTNSIPVVVDPKGRDWQKYGGCSVICPNQFELLEAREKYHKSWPVMLMKRGEDGLRLFTDGSGYVDIPATAKHVFDVTGAGDVVVAVFTAARAAGAALIDSAVLANLAAGWSVGEVGTVVCSKEKLIELTKEHEAGLERPK